MATGRGGSQVTLFCQSAGWWVVDSGSLDFPYVSVKNLGRNMAVAASASHGWGPCRPAAAGRIGAVYYGASPLRSHPAAPCGCLLPCAALPQLRPRPALPQRVAGAQ
jgi:hypothetical protein